MSFRVTLTGLQINNLFLVLTVFIELNLHLTCSGWDTSPVVDFFLKL